MWQNGIVLILLCTAAVAAVLLKKLDIKAAVTAVVIGFVAWLGAGYTGIALLVTFFAAGTLATAWKMHIKQQTGLAEQHKGQRTAGQVIANGGVAALLSLLSFLPGRDQPLLLVMIASGLSSATADTLSSELGNVYGRQFYNILSFKKDTRGLNGVISVEGTIAGIAGSCLIALIYALHAGFTVHFLWIVIAGTIGNITDSVLGAALERRQLLNNNAVNFLNTLIAALVGLLLYYF